MSLKVVFYYDLHLLLYQESNIIKYVNEWTNECGNVLITWHWVSQLVPHSCTIVKIYTWRNNGQENEVWMSERIENREKNVKVHLRILI